MAAGKKVGIGVVVFAIAALALWGGGVFDKRDEKESVRAFRDKLDAIKIKLVEAQFASGDEEAHLSAQELNALVSSLKEEAWFGTMKSRAAKRAEMSIEAVRATAEATQVSSQLLDEPQGSQGYEEKLKLLGGQIDLISSVAYTDAELLRNGLGQVALVLMVILAFNVCWR